MPGEYAKKGLASRFSLALAFRVEGHFFHCSRVVSGRNWKRY